MKIFQVIAFLACFSATVFGQNNTSFTVTVAPDSILFGNTFDVTFKLENTNGNNFQAPSFHDFELVSGPNTSSSMSIFNGQVTQSVAYRFRLRPVDIGNYYIGPASVEVDGRVIETQPIEIVVAPNPDGIIQQPTPQRQQFQFDFGDPFSPDSSFDFGDSFGFGQDFFQLQDSLFNNRMLDLNQLFENHPFFNGEDLFEMPAPPQDSTNTKKKRKIYKL